jgi:hypothetical protein
MKFYIQGSEQSDKPIFRLVIPVWKRRINTIHNPPWVYLNIDTVSATEGLFVFNNDNCSQDSFASLRSFALRNGIQITKFHI